MRSRVRSLKYGKKKTILGGKIISQKRTLKEKPLRGNITAKNRKITEMRGVLEAADRKESKPDEKERVCSVGKNVRLS